jgi:hypothetical protein
VIFVLKKAFRGSGVDGGVVVAGTGRSIKLFVVPGEGGERAEKRQGEEKQQGVKPRQEYGAQTRYGRG